MNVACWIPLASTYIEDLIAVCSSKPADAKILASACALYPFCDIYSLQLIHFGLFEYVGTDCHSHRFDVETSTYHKACHLRWLCVVQALATSRGLYVQSRKIPHMLDRSSQCCLYILTIPSMKAASTSMDQTSFDEHSSLIFSFYLLFFHSRHASCDTSSRVLEADRLCTGGCFGNDVVDLFLLSIRRGITGNTIEECLIIFRKKKMERKKGIFFSSPCDLLLVTEGSIHMQFLSISTAGVLETSKSACETTIAKMVVCESTSDVQPLVPLGLN